ESGRTSMRNIRIMNLAMRMNALTLPAEKGARAARDWSLDDLDAIAAEEESPAPLSEVDEGYYPSGELLQTMQAPAEKITHCAMVMERLKGKNWHLTKQVYTFRPEEMEDLEFEPAIPALGALLAVPEGRV